MHDIGKYPSFCDCCGEILINRDHAYRHYKKLPLHKPRQSSCDEELRIQVRVSHAMIQVRESVKKTNDSVQNGTFRLPSEPARVHAFN